MPDYLLAIDQGTTSTRAILFDTALVPVAGAQQEFAQIYPAPGLVEHDPEAIWSTTLATVRAAMAKAGAGARDIAALGITNQRETAIVWDRATGRPIHNAIVWQDRRTADACAALRTAGHEPMVAARTGGESSSGGFGRGASGDFRPGVTRRLEARPGRGRRRAARA